MMNENEGKTYEENEKIPEDGEEWKEPGEEQQATEPSESATDEVEQDEETGFEVAGKKFSSKEEADEYFKALESKSSSQTFAAPVVTVEDEEELIDGEPISDLFLTNPKKALKHVEEKAFKRAQDAFYSNAEKKKKETDFWEDFYGKNKDLKGKEWVVRSHMQEKWDTYKVMDADKAKEIIAKESRKRINSLLKANGVKVEEVSSNKPTNFGSSKNGSTATSEAPAKILSMSESLRKLKQRRRA